MSEIDAFGARHFTLLALEDHSYATPKKSDLPPGSVFHDRDEKHRVVGLSVFRKRAQASTSEREVVTVCLFEHASFLGF